MELSKLFYTRPSLFLYIICYISINWGAYGN